MKNGIFGVCVIRVLLLSGLCSSLAWDRAAAKESASLPLEHRIEQLESEVQRLREAVGCKKSRHQKSEVATGVTAKTKA